MTWISENIDMFFSADGPFQSFVQLASNAFGATSKLVKNLLAKCTTKITPMILLGLLKRMCRPGHKFSTAFLMKSVPPRHATSVLLAHVP
jgi:hypothetical protein